MTEPKKQIRIKASHFFFVIAAVVILAVWANIRYYAFWLPHWKGDQGHYVALAMKLDRLGLDGYSLRNVDAKFADSRTDSALQFIYPDYNPTVEEGSLLLVLRQFAGQGYYNEPLHMRAPLFSYALMFSHHLFMKPTQPYLVCSTNLAENVRSTRPFQIFKVQFWASIVPVFFNFLVMLLVFLLGFKFLNARTGFYAAFLIATNPVSVLTSYRLLSEDMCVFFIALSCFIFLWAYPKKNIIGIAFAGLSAGLAILTKQTSGVLLAVVWLYTFLKSEEKRRDMKGFLKSVFNKEFLVYSAAAFVISAFWFLKVIQVYGDPLHTPASGMALSAKEQDISGWFKVLNRRLTPTLFFSLGVFWIFPLFSFSLLTLRRFRRQWNNVWLDARSESDLLFFWIWILFFYLTCTQPWRLLTIGYNQEHRYFYLAYPAIALLSAYALDQFRQMIASFSKWRWTVEIIVILLLIMNARIGLSKVMGVIFSNNMLL